MAAGLLWILDAGNNDYSYMKDPDKDYDNRWMHRPLIIPEKSKKIFIKVTIENRIFILTKKLISLRNKLSALSDKKNITWLNINNNHVSGFFKGLGR